ncbi:hypothetical protein [Intrasporangium sp.]|uniref:hypothetical protein n=1 Tax=Intrasporangium sp. TaxID=1925024 RepID=UPI0032214B37
MGAYAAALAGMLLYGVASVAQAYAAGRASGAAVLRHPAYVAGLGCDLLAWVASLVALAVLPLFVVQSLLAGSLAVTVVLSRLVLGTRFGPSARVATVAVVVGLGCVSWSAGTESSRPVPEWFTAALLTLLVGVALAGVALYPHGGSTRLATLAALAFSGAAMGARAVTFDEASRPAVLRDPIAWTILAFGALGAILYARSLERGEVGPATAVLWVVEVVMPGVVGVLALGDTVRPGTAGLAVLGVGLAVAGTVALAQQPVHGGTDPVRSG